MSSRVIPDAAGRHQELVWDVSSGPTEQEQVQRVHKPLRNWEENKCEPRPVVEMHRHRGEGHHPVLLLRCSWDLICRSNSLEHEQAGSKPGHAACPGSHPGLPGAENKCSRWVQSAITPHERAHQTMPVTGVSHCVLRCCCDTVTTCKGGPWSPLRIKECLKQA